MKYPKPIFYDKLKNIEWVKIYSREYGVRYSEMAIDCIGPKASHRIPSPSVDQIIVPEGGNTAFFIDKESWRRLVASLDEKYTSHIDRLIKYEKDFKKTGKKYVLLAKKISLMDLTHKTNYELFQLYTSYQAILFEYAIFVWASFVLNNYVSQKATSIIDKYLKRTNLQDKKHDVLDALFHPLKLAALLRLQQQVENFYGKLPKNIFIKLYDKYKWLSCLDLHNTPWTQKEFHQVINSFNKSTSVKRKPFQFYTHVLNINKKDLQYLRMAQRFVYIKDARDDFRRQGIFYILTLFAEIARRMNINAPDVSYVASTEITNFFKKGTPVSQKTINARKKGFVMYLDKKSNLVVLEQNIEKIITDFGLLNASTNRGPISGTVASKGKVTGEVVIVYTIKDLDKVREGSILVAPTTHPSFTIAMRKAAAIVTDEGGITSHAAIVSREFGIPCIVGTQKATKVLKDGMRVEVDAESGLINML